MGSEDGLSRRDLLKKAGLGGAALLGGSVLGASVGDEAQASSGGSVYGGDGHRGHTAVGEDVSSTIYGHGAGPPRGIDPAALDSHTFPAPPDGRPAGAVRELEFRVEERLIEVGHDVFIEAWTYNGTVPAPVIRATEGDRLRIHFENNTGHAHSLHFHGAHRPEMDGWGADPARRRDRL